MTKRLRDQGSPGAFRCLRGEVGSFILTIRKNDAGGIVFGPDL